MKLKYKTIYFLRDKDFFTGIAGVDIVNLKDETIGEANIRFNYLFSDLEVEILEKASMVYPKAANFDKEVFDKFEDTFIDFIGGFEKVNNYFIELKNEINNNNLENFNIVQDTNFGLITTIILSNDVLAIFKYCKEKKHSRDFNAIKFNKFIDGTKFILEESYFNEKEFCDKQFKKIINSKKLRLKFLLNKK